MSTIKNIQDKQEWEVFLKKHSEANFLQSWFWGEFHQALGNKIFRMGFYSDGKLDGVMLGIVEKAKRATYLTVSGGPIINWNDQTIVRMFDHGIRRIAKENACVFVRVRPQLAESISSIELFKKMGFRNAPMHLHAELTNQLDITKSKDELLANMRKGTRYEIRKAEKIGIEVKESRNPKMIRKFYNLQLKTAKRQGFVPFSYKFLYEQFKVFTESNHAVLYSAFIDKKLLAQAFIIFYGNEAVYHYGASTQEGRRYPGAYLILWKTILEAKKRGLKKYNFWGVTREENHRFANLSLFKRGFGGEDFAYLHAQDLVINKHRYLLNYLIELIRKKIRRV
jgi:lipid II:glycine glycyltransferase (peptidoglycan interpeptide bridge formation enzyme)